MDLVELYYELTGGYPSETNEYKIKSQKVIDYLKDCGFGEKEIITFICTAPDKDFLSPEMLPDFLWMDSLLKRDKFYYHHMLHIISKPPIWDPITETQKVEKFYMEMKIKFTMQDLINYLYKTLSIDFELMDFKKDSGSLNYLLNKFQKYKFIEPIDFLLFLIDYAADADEEKTIKNVLDIAEYEGIVYEKLQKKVEEATIAKANIAVWR